MNTVKTLHQEIDKLSPSSHEKVLEYINFLQLSEQQEKDVLLTPAQKIELEAHYLRYIENPSSGRSLDEVCQS